MDDDVETAEIESLMAALSTIVTGPSAQDKLHLYFRAYLEGSSARMVPITLPATPSLLERRILKTSHAFI
eukprot:COSAG05_NODE_1910_length_3845_cov_2.662306_2_plen_70_part_00